MIGKFLTKIVLVGVSRAQTAGFRSSLYMRLSLVVGLSLLIGTITASTTATAASRSELSIAKVTIDPDSGAVAVELKRATKAMRTLELWRIRPSGFKVIRRKIKIPPHSNRVELSPRPQAGSYVVRIVGDKGKDKGPYSKKFKLFKLETSNPSDPFEPQPSPPDNNPGPPQITPTPTSGDSEENQPECSFDSTPLDGCPLSCGNGSLDAQEECDDGNSVSFDGCSNLCRIEVLTCFNKAQDNNEAGVDCGGPCDFPCPSNFKSGIDLLFDGTPGREYAEEYLYHDKLIDDHKVVYIKDSTPILMQHNERNIIGTSEVIGINGSDNNPHSGDEGQIRFRVDQELNYQLGYAGNVNYPYGVLPSAYTGPFSFKALHYLDNLPVLETVGDNGLSITDKQNYTTYGLLDDFGDEWHSMAYWDDDTWIGQAPSKTEWWASDGKITQFVVNPKTPIIHFTVKNESGQFYTTPAKVYFTQRIHPQTTYLSGLVEIELTNIMSDEPIYFSINDSPIKVYSGPISTDLLSDGENVIEYYYRSDYKKIRTIVKNPAYPSDQDIIVGQDEDVNLLWKSEADYQALRARLLSGSSASGYSWQRDTNSIYGGNGHTEIAQKLGKGYRKGVNFALINALVTAIEGAAARPNHASAAKKALLDSSLALDLLGCERAGPFQPLPYREREYRGYYDVNNAYDKAFAYDLLIKYYRATDYPGGITAIEDFKIRDLLASWVHERLLAHGGYTHTSPNTPSTTPNSGMWGTAKDTGAIAIMLAMPAYNTSYYGTNGLSGQMAMHLHAPFPDYPVSWKDLFLTYTNNSDPNHVAKIYGYPNQQQMFNPFDGGIVTNQTTYVNRVLTDGTTVTELPPGSFADRIPYYEYSLMGHTFHIFANLLKINLDVEYPYLNKSFENSNIGQLFGLKITTPSDADPKYFPQYLLVNKYTPTSVATGARDYILAHPDNYGYFTAPYGLILYDPDWAP